MGDFHFVLPSTASSGPRQMHIKTKPRVPGRSVLGPQQDAPGRASILALIHHPPEPARDAELDICPNA